MDLCDLLELSKFLLKIGAKICECLWLNLHKKNFPERGLEVAGFSIIPSHLDPRSLSQTILSSSSFFVSFSLYYRLKKL